MSKIVYETATEMDEHDVNDDVLYGVPIGSYVVQIVHEYNIYILKDILCAPLASLGCTVLYY